MPIAQVSVGSRLAWKTQATATCLQEVGWGECRDPETNHGVISRQRHDLGQESAADRTALPRGEPTSGILLVVPSAYPASIRRTKSCQWHEEAGASIEEAQGRDMTHSPNSARKSGSWCSIQRAWQPPASPTSAAGRPALAEHQSPRLT